VSFAPLPLYARGKAPNTHWIRCGVDPKAGLPGLELRPLGRPSRHYTDYYFRSATREQRRYQHFLAPRLCYVDQVTETANKAIDRSITLVLHTCYDNSD
jgi:hypothetical protein